MSKSAPPCLPSKLRHRPCPMITEDIGNTTVALGREATLKCVVTHLLDYKVSLSLSLSLSPSLIRTPR